MGIKGLTQLITKYVPFAFSEVQLSAFSKRRVAIDANLMITRFMMSTQSIFPFPKFKHLAALKNFVDYLRFNQTEPIFVFDGTDKLAAKFENAGVKRIASRSNFFLEYLITLRCFEQFKMLATCANGQVLEIKDLRDLEYRDQEALERARLKYPEVAVWLLDEQLAQKELASKTNLHGLDYLQSYVEVTQRLAEKANLILDLSPHEVISI